MSSAGKVMSSRGETRVEQNIEMNVLECFSLVIMDSGRLIPSYK